MVRLWFLDFLNETISFWNSVDWVGLDWTGSDWVGLFLPLMGSTSIPLGLSMTWILLVVASMIFNLSTTNPFSLPKPIYGSPAHVQKKFFPNQSKATSSIWPSMFAKISTLEPLDGHSFWILEFWLPWLPIKRHLKINF